MSTQHFLTLRDLEASTLKALITRAIELKAIRHKGGSHEPLHNKHSG